MWSKKVIKRLPADMWELEGNINQVGYLSVTVPGTLKALYEVANRFGTMNWKNLIKPSIDLAKKGFIIPAELHQSWKYDGSLGYSDTEDILKFNSISSQIFAPYGNILKTGERLIMQDYAAVLDSISEIICEESHLSRIEIRNFGVFEVKPTKAKPKARNPKTNEVIYVPPRKKVSYKPGKNIKKILNKERT